MRRKLYNVKSNRRVHEEYKQTQVFKANNIKKWLVKSITREEETDLYIKTGKSKDLTHMYIILSLVNPMSILLIN